MHIHKFHAEWFVQQSETCFAVLGAMHWFQGSHWLQEVSEWLVGEWSGLLPLRGDDYFLDDIISERSLLTTPKMVDSSCHSWC